MKTYDGVFEVFEVSVRRLRNGNKLSIVLEMPESIEEEKKLIEFRYENVKLSIAQEDNEENGLAGIFEVMDVKCRSLRNGNKLRVVFEQMYNKETELEALRPKIKFKG